MRETWQMRSRDIALAFTVFFAVALQDLPACSTSIIGADEVSAHFAVRIVTHGRPVVGLQIELRILPGRSPGDSRVVATRTTDENGLVNFAAPKPGSYSVDVKHQAFPSYANVLVKSHTDKNAHQLVTVEWPNTEILYVQSVAGLLKGQIRTGNPLSDQAHPVMAPLNDAKLTLLQAVSGEIVGEQVAGPSGAFGFASVGPGLYLLHVISPQNLQTHQIGYDGYVPIEIDSSVKLASLNLSIFPPMCGSITYRNEEGVAVQ